MSAAHAVSLGVAGTCVLGAALFVLRPELWARLWWTRVDPRPAALMRIGFGLVVLWTFVGYAGAARTLWSDEGMWLPDMARAEFGGTLSHLWDPDHGFAHWWSAPLLLYGKFTILHYWSPPWLVFLLYGLALASVALMTLGAWTRWTTTLAWILVLQLYRYQPMYLTGGDRVIQDFLFLGMLTRWGEAYSLDAWRRPAPSRERGIPAWPLRLMMAQLALIYCATGLFKSGPAWAHGEALYYALNLDHFYRVPATALVARLQHAGLLPLGTHLVRWWEVLFPLLLVGAVLRAYEADRQAGRWPVAPAWRRRASWAVAGGAWLLAAGVAGIVAAHHGLAGFGRPRAVAAVVAMAVAVASAAAIAVYALIRRYPGPRRLLLHWVLGKRCWLTFGVLLHVGIDAGVNVGTFANVMIPLYFGWLSGPELDAVRRAIGRPVVTGAPPPELAVDTAERGSG